MSREMEVKADVGQNDNSATNAELSAPKYLNTQFLEKHLRKYYNNQHLRVVNFESNFGTGKRENFCSSLYRVNVTFTNGSDSSSLNKNQNLQNLKMIVKAAVSGEGLGALSEFDIYKKEMIFYNQIAPLIKKLLVKLGETSQLTAQIIGVCETNMAILLEDLSEKSFGLASVYQGLGLNDAKVVLRKAAILHAINVALQQENQNVFEHFKYGMISRHTDAFNALYNSQLNALIEVIDSWAEFAVYTAKLRALQPNFIEKLRIVFDVNPNHFNTLIHGDMWINNLTMKLVKPSAQNDSSMSNNVEQGVEDMIFIDFQYSCWASPMIDLHFLFNISLHESLRTQYFDELLRFYHEHLSICLKRLGHNKEIPTFDELMQQYLDRSLYGFTASCLDQPIVINENTEKADIEALLGDDERSKSYKRLMYQSPRVQANLRKLNPIFDRLGIFD